MNSKISQEKNQVINNNPIVKAISREEISRRIAEIQDSLKASTWKELETKGKFTKEGTGNEREIHQRRKAYIHQ